MQKNMETNTCNVNHLDADAHLPPRKRLLAGLKRQISDLNSPTPSTPSSGVIESDVHLNSALRSQLSDSSLSNEEIVEASRIAAMNAAKVAEAARAIAEEKAAKAAKAVAAAKNALDLVAILSDEVGSKEKLLKKNKMKKHVTVEALYNKNRSGTNCRTTDEEMARNLHRVINSSPRIMKNSPGSDAKSHKHKRLKTSASSGKASGSPDVEGDRPSPAKNNVNGVADVGTESPIKKIDMIMVDLNASKDDDGDDQLKLDNGEGSRLSKSERLKLDEGEVLDSVSRKRGRIKQKKLPLSICSFKDQTSPKEETKPQGTKALEPVESQPLFSSNSLIPVERTPLWKCQSFKAPACVKQNKVIQS